MALITECPYKEPLPECPAAELRDLSVTEQLNAVEKLDEETIDRVLAIHGTCLDGREGRPLSPKSS
jgi:hypothetical protein